MNKTQLKLILGGGGETGYLDKLFPKNTLTQDERDWFLQQIRAKDYEAVHKAISKHRQTNDYPNPELGRILASLRVPEFASGKAYASNRKHIDTLRFHHGTIGNAADVMEREMCQQARRWPEAIARESWPRLARIEMQGSGISDDKADEIIARAQSTAEGVLRGDIAKAEELHG